MKETAAERQTRPTAPAETSKPPEGMLLEARSPLLTRFRVLTGAILLLGGLTGWGLWHRSQIERAKAIVLPAKEAGLKALGEGDFPAAARELQRARDAVNLLGRQDPESNVIRRACQEAVAGDQLSGLGLYEILDESIANGKVRGLSSRHKQEWLPFDVIVLLPESSRPPLILDLPIQVEGKKCRIQIDSSDIRKAAQRAGEGSQSRVIFAAQASQIVADPDDDSSVIVTLNGKSAFLWTSYDTYAMLGYQESNPEQLQQTRDLLARQLQQLEETK